MKTAFDPAPSFAPCFSVSPVIADHQHLFRLVVVAYDACCFAGQLRRATRYLALRDEANVLDEEAATWQLLWHLAGSCDERFPGGWGGGEEAAAATLESGRTTVHQQVAAIIASDDAINRSLFLWPSA